jgi:hypothetical protein
VGSPGRVARVRLDLFCRVLRRVGFSGHGRGRSRNDNFHDEWGRSHLHFDVNLNVDLNVYFDFDFHVRWWHGRRRWRAHDL